MKEHKIQNRSQKNSQSCVPLTALPMYSLSCSTCSLYLLSFNWSCFSFHLSCFPCTFSFLLIISWFHYQRNCWLLFTGFTGNAHIFLISFNLFHTSLLLCLVLMAGCLIMMCSCKLWLIICSSHLKVHNIEIFFGFDFEICIISLLVMWKY